MIGTLAPRLAIAVACTCAATSACSRPFARVAGVTVADRPATGPVAGVTVVHEGTPTQAGPGTGLVPGDTIRTDAATRVRLEVTSDYEVYLEEGTELAVLNPKLFLKLGKAFIRSVREGLESVREALRVDTQYVIAAPTGTAFLLEVMPDSSVRYIVTEGVVRIEWRPQSDTVTRPAPWPPVEYGPLEGGIVRPGQPPERTPVLSREQVARELEWVREVERLTVAFVPDLRGASLDEARALLARARLRVGSVTETVQEGGRGGVVLDQELEAGERVRPDETVDLVVSVIGVRVPRLDGAQQSSAAQQLREAGLAAGATRREKVRGQRPGLVIRSDPPAGRLVRPGERITLVVTAPCTVPDLRGLTRVQAAERLTAELLTIGKVATVGRGTTVSGQTQKPGSDAVCGSSVDFTIGTIRDDGPA